MMELITQTIELLHVTGLGKMMVSAGILAAVTGFVAWLTKPRCPDCGRKMKGFYYARQDPIYVCWKCGKVLE
jgi:tRNA(Ile2) C34 agmatinyltransferase TiaS